MARMITKRGPADGQVDILGTVHGLERLVTPPEVIDSDGLKVIHFAISESDKQVPGYLAVIKEKARRLEPEVKSKGKAPWHTAEWQMKRRKMKAGVL